MNKANQEPINEIELERLWVTTEQGEYVVFTMLPISLVLIYGLWHTLPENQLIGWFLLLMATNILRWSVLRYYKTHKEELGANLQKFKQRMLLGAVLTGLCWVLAIVLFLKPSDPSNVLVISISLFIQIVGAVGTWYCYMPAVLAISFPPILLLIGRLFVDGDKANTVTGLIYCLLAVMVIVTGVKLSRMLNYALRLNFENETLRRESEEKSLLLGTALENLGQGISMADENDKLRMWNKEFTDFLGDVGGKVVTNINLTSILNSADPPVILNDRERIEYMMSDGRIFEIRQSTLRQGGRVVIYSDITDTMRRERSLKDARKEAIAANCAKTRFLATASHDLRQPIHALGLFFAELSDRVRTPETALVISQIEDSIEAINTMLNALLDVSKLDAGIIKPNVQTFNLAELFERLNLEFQQISVENQNKLRIRSGVAFVKTDPAMLERILRNLIGNALRYTKNGRVLVGCRERGETIEIQVIDTGLGIPEDKFDEIFVEFHQLHNPARDRRQGLGLGLAIVKRLANLLGHDLKVTSKVGKGSCFSIRLPVVAKEVAVLASQHSEISTTTNSSLIGYRLLVLDDDVAVREGMKGLLSRWGCDVITASSHSEAASILANVSSKIDLLIVDYRLSDAISGIDAARSLQNQLTYPVAVLIITGDTGPERLLEADGSRFPLLHKPVQPAKLRATLQYLIATEHKDNAANSEPLSY